MTRLTWKLVASLVLGSALIALAQTKPTTQELAAQRKELEDKKTALQAKDKEIREKIAKSDAVTELRKKADEAKAAVDKARTADPDIVKAKAAEKDAQAALAKAIADKVEADSASIAGQRKTLDGKKKEIQFKLGLVQLQLSHAYSPVKRQADAVPDVAAARAAMNAAEKADPSADVTAAAAKAREADAAVARANDTVSKDAKAAAAAAKLKEADAALKAAHAADDRGAKLTEARKALAAAREEALAKIAEAKPLVEELAAAEKQAKELQAQRQATFYLLDVLRDAQQDKDTAAARDKLAAAEAALAKLSDNAEYAALKKAQTDSEKKYDQTFERLIGKDADYAKLGGLVKEAQAKLEAAKAKIIKISSVDDVKGLRTEVAALRKQVTDSMAGQRSIRMKQEELGKCYNERASAQGELRRQVLASAAGSAANQAAKDARAALAKVLDAKIQSLPSAQQIQKELAAISDQLGEVQYREAVAKYKLQPFAPKVDADAGVVAKQQALAAIEKDIKDKPNAKVADAAKKHDDALAEQKTILATLHKDADYAKAATAKKDAEAALRKAQDADPKKAASAKAAQTYQEKLTSAIAAAPAGKELVEQRKGLDAELAATGTESTKLNAQVGDLQKKVAASDDAKIVAARKAAEDAQKATKAAETSQKIADLKKTADEASKAVDAKIKDLCAADADAKKLAEQMADIDKQIKALGRAPKPDVKPAPKKGAKNGEQK